MDIDEQLHGAGRRLKVIDPPQPDMAPLRERAIRSARRRASAALVSLTLLVGVGVVVAQSALMGDGGSGTEVVAAGDDPTPLPALMIEPDMIPIDGGEVAVTIAGDEDEFRAFNPMVEVYRLNDGDRLRLGRLYLDAVIGGGQAPELDPSTGIGYHAPTARLETRETSEHRLTFPRLDPGDYELEVQLYGVDRDDGGTWVLGEIVTATLTVSASARVDGGQGDPDVAPTVTYPDDGADRHPHVAPQPPPVAVTSDFGDEPSYVGLSEEQARMKAEDDGLLFRVVWRDGQHLPVRSDRRPDRVNVHIEDGVVVEAVRY